MRGLTWKRCGEGDVVAFWWQLLHFLVVRYSSTNTNLHFVLSAKTLLRSRCRLRTYSFMGLLAVCLADPMKIQVVGVQVVVVELVVVVVSDGWAMIFSAHLLAVLCTVIHFCSLRRATFRCPYTPCLFLKNLSLCLVYFSLSDGFLDDNVVLDSASTCAAHLCNFRFVTKLSIRQADLHQHLLFR